MSFLKKKQEKVGPVFFEEDPSEIRFDQMMDLVKDLDTEDYNRLKKAMDAGYKAYQIVKGIDTDDGTIPPSEFILHEKDGE